MYVISFISPNEFLGTNFSIVTIISETTLGTLPILCYNGVEIGQSVAIWRFLANEFGLAGKTNLERARADMIVDCVSDLFAGGSAIFKAPEDKKAELQAKYLNETIPKGFELLEKLLKQNGSKFFVGNCVSLIFQNKIYNFFLLISQAKKTRYSFCKN